MREKHVNDQSVDINNIRMLIIINLLKAPVEKIKNTRLLSIISTPTLQENVCQSRNVFSNFVENEGIKMRKVQ